MSKLLPEFEDERTVIRAVLSLGIVTGVAMTVYFAFLAPVSPLGWDFHAYHQAGEAVLAGDSFVGLEPDTGGGEFVYPPIVVLVFVPYALLSGWETAFVVHSAINVACLGTVGFLCLRELEKLGVELDRRDRYLIMAFALGSLYPLINLGLGQIDPLVSLLIIGIFLGVEREHNLIAGGAAALAGIIKLFPVVLGVWLLWLKRWRAITVAIVTGLTAVLASFAIFGWETNEAYLEVIIGSRSRLQAFAEGVSPDFFSLTLIRPISVLLQGLPAWTFLLVSVTIVGPILWFIYQRTSTRLDRHVAFLATVTAVLIALPSSNLNHLLYLYFPLIVLVYAIEEKQARRWLLGGMVILAIPLQPEIITSSLKVLPISETLLASVDAVASTTLSFASVALVGTVMLLVACVLYARDSSADAESNATKAV